MIQTKEMAMTNEQTFCWVLVVAGLVLLAVTSQLDLLAILVPGAVLLSVAVAGFANKKTGLTDTTKRG